MKQYAILGWAVLCFWMWAVLTPLGAADWPQWRGPQRNGISSETGWTSRWSAAGPRIVWRAQVGQGFSSVAVKGGRVYTMGNTNGRDTVYCLNATNGKVLWTHSYACDAGGYPGPRATPTVDGDKVYTLSREGHAFCLNAATGQVIWSADLQRQTGAYPPRWGFAGSPLVEGNLVIYNVGTAGVALDKNSGKLVWKSGAGTAGYASPVAFNVGNQRGVAIFSAQALIAVNPTNGRVLWQHPWYTSYDVNAADPIFAGEYVFISSNYNRGGALLKISGGRPQVVWENRNMRNHFNSCVLVNGYLYGNDEGRLACVEFRTGAERWRQGGMGKGGLIAADGNLICLTERGMLVIVKATPERYTELASAQVLRGTCWTQPVLANGFIFCRSHEGELVCVDVRGK
ncbi:MAG: PQQ-like beta-propeller repeat protein [Abditibacteriales bacterium]|nr:PQQ-like beta-propeller repeat protein [Abditibacteriales bacterium]MDW8367061.1 PQQ-binding-like beta-propeller repeat protein [Abditibacteriales bacterium]